MSDRIAVFNHGPPRAGRHPAEVYERPASEFIAGFVGVSNLLERDGRRFTVRPEKIHLRSESERGDDGVEHEVGEIRDSIYLGSVTRYLVELDKGEKLTVVRQNLETTSTDALESRGRRVRLEWRPEHTVTVNSEGNTEETR